MDLVHSKDIYYIMRDVLKLLDPRTVAHGQRTAYILYRMLKSLNRYEMYELAEYAMIAVIHDIGAFETDRGVDPIQYETREFMPHSIYGYLFLLYIMPFKDRAKILLYHHTDYAKLEKLKYEHKDIIDYLNLAEKVDVYLNLLGERFDVNVFKKQSGTKYSPQALDLFYSVNSRFDVLGHIKSGDYLAELDELFEYLIFTNQEKKDSIAGLMYCVGFRSEYTMLDVVTCENICSQLSRRLGFTLEEEEKLHYAAILHDAGMCSVPQEIIEAPRKLTDEEMETMRKHVDILDEILRGRFDQEVVDIIKVHHERGNGMGYPQGLDASQMTRIQKALQVADTITGLTSVRSYRQPKSKQQVIEILKSEASSGKLNAEIVRKFTNSYDEIMDEVKEKNEEMLTMYRKLRDNYKTTYEQNK
ncbi:MAG: HD domain-containing protein [Lachnospiraceae bacterium]|nr:HD domain-containing protein [Lachnospiraceae bacterium]